MTANAACLAALAGLLAVGQPGWAAALSVAPISLEMTAPAESVVLTLRNRESHPISVQIRTFRWSQADGIDHLEPTDAIVASPPIVQVGPNGSYLVRLQQVAGAMADKEAAYRVVVDELPDLGRQRNGVITVLLRYSVPLFVGSPEASPPRLTWRLAPGGGGSVLSAENAGDRRIQISALALKTGRRAVLVGPGLAGYVLGHATRRWHVPPGATLAGPVTVSSGSDHGPISAALAP